MKMIYKRFKILKIVHSVHICFQVPLPLPIFMALVSFFLVFAPFIEEVLDEYLYGIAVMVFFLLLYYPFVYKKYKVPGIGWYNYRINYVINFKNQKAACREYNEHRCKYDA